MHDDWLDDGADDTAGDAEWHRLERNFGALGFQDGVGIGIENAVQGGFDEGFLQASREGMAEGELYGIVSALDDFYGAAGVESVADPAALEQLHALHARLKAGELTEPLPAAAVTPPATSSGCGCGKKEDEGCCQREAGDAAAKDVSGSASDGNGPVPSESEASCGCGREGECGAAEEPAGIETAAVAPPLQADAAAVASCECGKEQRCGEAQPALAQQRAAIACAHDAVTPAHVRALRRELEIIVRGLGLPAGFPSPSSSGGGGGDGDVPPSW